MKKITLLGLMALLVVGLVASSAMAFPAPSQVSQGFGKFHRGPAKGGPMKEVFESGNYDKYLSMFNQTDRPYMKQKLTKEQFDNKTKHIALMKERRSEMQKHRETIHSAIESGSYSQWNSVLDSLEAEHPLADKITENNFATFVKLHEARENKEFDKVKELAEKLGMEKPMRQGQGQGKRMGGQGKGSCGCGINSDSGKSFQNSKGQRSGFIKRIGGMFNR